MDEHVIASSFQAGPRLVQVLLPDAYDATSRYPVLYVLPVEPQGQCVYGDGLTVLRELDVANRYSVILVQPGFSHTPWYVDHATDLAARPASHLEQAVVPFIEERYATLAGRAGRLLIGFSKSGWGALSMILRNPAFWGYAAAWDAPLMMVNYHWNVVDDFGTAAQFDAHRPDQLAPRVADSFRQNPRLVLGGERSWGPLRDGPPKPGHTHGFHQLLEQLAIPHTFRPDLCVQHTWNPGWVEPMVEELMRLAG
jgi:hypothetical protein